jgi:hypothetical protein
VTLRYCSFALLSIASICRVLPAQEMSTDRPDFTEGTGLVGRGVFQFENGFTVAREHGMYSLSDGEFLLRVGVSGRAELRFGAEGFLTEWARDQAPSRGYSDIALATKIQLTAESRFAPAVSVIPILSMPSGSRTYSSRGFDPTLKIAWSKTLARGFSLGGNVNFSSGTTDDGRFTQRAFSWSLSHELPAGLSAYWEIFGFSPWDCGTGAAWVANTGVSRQTGKSTRMDVRVGKRITNAGPDWFVGMGVAIRKPTALFQ